MKLLLKGYHQKTILSKEEVCIPSSLFDRNIWRSLLFLHLVKNWKVIAEQNGCMCIPITLSQVISNVYYHWLRCYIMLWVWIKFQLEVSYDDLYISAFISHFTSVRMTFKENWAIKFPPKKFLQFCESVFL